MGELSKPKEGEDYYLEDGMMVFTETYHRKRGYCCESNCRHCPFGFKVKTERRESTPRQQ